MIIKKMQKVKENPQKAGVRYALFGRLINLAEGQTPC
jgi:hypothetical protein